MSIKVKTSYLTGIVLILFISTFFIGKYFGRQKTENVLNSVISSQEGKINSYIIMLGDAKKYVKEKEQEIITLKEAKKQGDITNAELRKLHIKDLQEINRLNLQIDTLLDNVIHNGDIVIIQQKQIDSLSKETKKAPQYAIKLPFSFEKKDQWLDLKGDFDSGGKLAIGIKIDVPIDIYTGWDKTLKTYKAVVVTTNPYIRVLDIKSQKFDLKKPKKIGIGLFVGYGINLSTIKASPVLGAGLSYNPIRF